LAQGPRPARFEDPREPRRATPARRRAGRSARSLPLRPRFAPRADPAAMAAVAAMAAPAPPAEARSRPRGRPTRAAAALAALAALAAAAPALRAAPGRALADVGEAAKAALSAAVPSPLREGKPHLLGFYAEQSMEAKRMRFLGDLLEKELPGVKIVWLEAWENPLNEKLRATIDLRNQCGGVPYLFNRKTGKVLCGVVPYDKLRAWAQGLGGDARIYRDIQR